MSPPQNLNEKRNPSKVNEEGNKVEKEENKTNDGDTFMSEGAKETVAAPGQVVDDQALNMAMLEEYLMKEDDGMDKKMPQEQMNKMPEEQMDKMPQEQMGKRPEANAEVGNIATKNNSDLSFHSLASNSSMVMKMGKLEMKNSISSTNEFGKRKEATVVLDTASSSLKRSRAKKTKI